MDSRQLTLSLTLLTTLSALSTDRCSHEVLVDTIAAMESCITDIGTEVEFCQAHKDILSCSSRGLAACFGEKEVEAIIKVQKAELRTATEAVFSPSVFVDVKLQEQLKNLLDSCYYIPSREEAQRTEMKRLYWLDYVQTDGNCSRVEVGQVQASLEACMDKQTRQFQTQISGIKTAVSLQQKVCKIMNKTYGHCFRLIYPSCFSARDSQYLDSQSVELFREGLEVAQEPGLLDFSMSECLAHYSSSQGKATRHSPLLSVCVLAVVSAWLY